jgi:glycine cleavage system aminomethyltransferase T
MLNTRGGIESDLTVTRLSETAFLLVVPGATLQRDLAGSARHLGGEFVATITDMTAAEAVFCVMGPNARSLCRMQPRMTSNEALPFGTAREIEIGMGLARAHRVPMSASSAGSFMSRTDQAAHVFERWRKREAITGSSSAGCTRSTCRIEKAFRHFGHDITDEDHVLEAGLGFAVKTKKPDFIGRDAVLAKREQGLGRRHGAVPAHRSRALAVPQRGVVRDGEIVSIVTSGNYGHHLGGAIGMGYVPCAGESAEDVLASTYEIEIAGERHSAIASLKPLYDPGALRVRM